MKIRSKSFLACCLAGAVVAVVSWWGTAAEPELGQLAAVEQVTARVVDQSSVDSPWAGSNPFAPLQCKFENGQRFESSACNPAPEHSSAVDLERPEFAASNALTKIKAGEFDKLPVLAVSLNDCWFVRAPSLNKHEPLNQQVSPECNFAEVERFVNTAESFLHAASAQGDYMAREAYVNLLSAKVMVRQNQLEFFDPLSKAPVSVSDVERLHSEINATRDQIINFIRPLRDPSNELVEYSQTLAVLRDTSVQENNAEPGSR